MLPPAPQTFLDTFWRGQNRRLALALHEGFLLFWEPDSAQFQSAPQEWVFAVEHQLCFGDENQMTAPLLSSELEWALANNRVGRRFHLADTITVFLLATDAGIDYEEYESKECSLVFRLGDTRKCARFGGGFKQLFERPLSHWMEQLEREALDGPLGYEVFADALAEEDIPFVANTPTTLRMANGTEAEMKKVADLIFQTAPEWIAQALSLPKNEGGAGIIVVLPLGRPSRYVCVGQMKNYGLVPVPHPRAALWDIWLRYFGPQPDTDFHRKDIDAGVRLFTCGHWPDFFERFDWRSRRVEELSQHERMEVNLELRDWLRDDVGLSDQRIAELLA